MKKGTMFTVLMATFMFITFFLAFFSLMSKAYLQYYGAAVDSEGNVFIGTNYGIDVYDNTSQRLYRITPVPKGYNFTLWNDTLYIRDPRYVSIRTRTGDLIERISYSENGNLPEYMRYSDADRKRFISESGDEYTLRIKGLRLSVIKNKGSVVYRESWPPAILRFTLKVSAALTIMFFCMTGVLDFLEKKRR